MLCVPSYIKFAYKTEHHITTESESVWMQRIYGTHYFEEDYVSCGVTPVKLLIEI